MLNGRAAAAGARAPNASRPSASTAVAGTSDPSLTPVQKRRVLVVGFTALVLYLSDSLVRHSRYHSGFDLTIFDQAINQYAHLRAPDVLVKSQAPFNILGDHFHPILMLLAPFYRIWPDARMLLVAQAVLMAIAVHVVCRLAVRRLGRTGYYIGIAFALSWGILQAVDFDFHEIAFAVPLLALALEALLAGRIVATLGWTVPLVLVKEDSPLLVIGVALVLLAQRRWRPAVLLGIFGVLSFVLVVFVVIPYFSYSGTYTYFAYAGNPADSGGLGGLVSSALGTVFSLRGLIFLGALALTAGLGLRSKLLLALLPTIGARFVSNNHAYTGFLFHYNATLMVICFVALVDGVARTRAARTAGGARGRPALLLRLQGIALAGVVLLGIIRAPTSASILSGFLPCDRCAAADQAVADIPDGARVAADVFLMPHLVDRAQVMMADPTFTDSTDLPIKADWVILDLDSTSYTPGWSARLLAGLLDRGRYRIVDQPGQFVVLKSN